jgi:hypothetical protein
MAWKINILNEDINELIRVKITVENGYYYNYNNSYEKGTNSWDSIPHKEVIELLKTKEYSDTEIVSIIEVCSNCENDRPFEFELNRFYSSETNTSPKGVIIIMDVTSLRSAEVKHPVQKTSGSVNNEIGGSQT